MQDHGADRKWQNPIKAGLQKHSLWRVWRRGRNDCGQAIKGVWGMSWRQKAMKGVEGCDKPGGAVKRALIPGSLNYRMMNT